MERILSSDLLGTSEKSLRERRPSRRFLLGDLLEHSHRLLSDLPQREDLRVVFYPFLGSSIQRIPLIGHLWSREDLKEDIY